MKDLGWKLFWGLLRRFESLHFAGSKFRMAWSVLTPFLVASVVAGVFFGIFKAPSKEPVLVVLSGMIFWQWFQGTLSQGNRIFLDQRHFFKSLQSPREYFIPAFVLFRTLLATPVVLLMALGIWIVLGFSLAHGLLFLVLFFLSILCIVGLTFLFSTWTVFWPDVSHGLESSLSLLLWLSPVFYSGTQIPNDFRWMVWLNPFAWFLEGVRACLNLSHILSLWICIPLFGLFSVWILFFGLFYFRKHKKELLSFL